jgi:hypothetical protein
VPILNHRRWLDCARNQPSAAQARWTASRGLLDSAYAINRFTTSAARCSGGPTKPPATGVVAIDVSL